MTKHSQPPSTPSAPCTQAEEAILALLDDEEATPEQQALLSEHLGQCPACRSYQTAMQNLTHSIRELDEVPVPAGLELKIMSRIAEEASATASLSTSEQNGIDQEPAAESIAQDDNLVDFPKYAPSRQNHRLKLIPVAAAILTVALSLPLIFQAINPNMPEHQASQLASNPGAVQFSHSDSHEAPSAHVALGSGSLETLSEQPEEQTATTGGETEGNAPASSRTAVSAAPGSDEIASINVANAYASNKEGDIYFDPLSNVVDF